MGTGSSHPPGKLTTSYLYREGLALSWPRKDMAMDFSKPPKPMGHSAPRRAEPPIEPTEEDLGIPMAIGPAETTRPGVPNPFEVAPPGIDAGPPLAFVLDWSLPR